MDVQRWAMILPMLAAATILGGCGENEVASTMTEETTIVLPEPVYDSDVSLEETLLERRSIRQS